MRIRLGLLALLLLAACESGAGGEHGAPADTAAPDDVSGAGDATGVADTVGARDTTAGADLTSSSDAAGAGDTAPGGDSGAPPPDTVADGAAADDGAMAADVGGGPSEPVTLTTADGLAIRGRFDAPPGGPHAGALLLHQYGNDRSQWDDVLPDLLSRGYAVLRIDLRSHGESDAHPAGRVAMLTDPDGAPHDVRAALAWLAARPEVDADRLGVVGTSVGSNLSYLALYERIAHAGVAFSPRTTSVEALTEAAAADLSFPPTFCVAGALDNDGVNAATCETFRPLTDAPNPVHVEPDSADHGVAFLAYPALWTAALDHLDAVLAAAP